MGQGRIKEAPAWTAGFKPRHAPVTAKAADWLRARYNDDEGEAAGQVDGAAALLGPAGGPGNGVLHGGQAVRESSVTGTLGGRNYLDGRGHLGKIREAQGCALQAFLAFLGILGIGDLTMTSVFS